MNKKEKTPSINKHINDHNITGIIQGGFDLAEGTYQAEEQKRPGASTRELN